MHDSTSTGKRLIGDIIMPEIVLDEDACGFERVGDMVVQDKKYSAIQINFALPVSGNSPAPHNARRSDGDPHAGLQ